MWGPKDWKERNGEQCCYGEFLEGRAWDAKDVEEMEEKIRSMRRFKEAIRKSSYPRDPMIMRLMQKPETLAKIIGTNSNTIAAFWDILDYYDINLSDISPETNKKFKDISLPIFC